MKRPCPTCRKLSVGASPHSIGQIYCALCLEAWRSWEAWEREIELAAGLRWCNRCQGKDADCKLCYGTATR